MVTRPILRYHGGKFLLAPWIISHFPKHKVYVELFGGAASVLLQKDRSYAEVYNDLDDEVVNLFKVCREYPNDIVRSLELTPFSKTEFNNSYSYDCTPVELARRTIIRSYMGFGSGIQSKNKTGFRANSNRSGTTPAKDWNNFPEALVLIIQRLKGVIIENKNYADIADQHDGNDTLFYWDPPYKKSTRFKGERTDVYKHEMSDADHEIMLRKAISIKGMSVISGYDNDLYNDLLLGWRKSQKSALADGAKKRVEVLWISPNVNLNQQILKL